MSYPLRLLRRLVGAAAGATLALAATAPGAHAGLLVSSAQNCPSVTIERPFERWGDFANYVLAPGGSVETVDTWTLRGAWKVSGNEPWQVHSPDDRNALRIPGGASATTAPMCVGIEYPTLRFFARNDGALLSTLRVDALIRDNLGLLRSLPVGVVIAGESWRPTLPYPVLASLLPLLPGAKTPVRFRFTASSGGDWRIDDIYVDPYRA